jgi:hypothetical protein
MTHKNPDPLCPTLIPDGWHYDYCTTCSDYKNIRQDERNNIAIVIQDYFKGVPSLNKVHVDALVNSIVNPS